MTIQDLIKELSEKLEIAGNYETNDIYDTGYYRGQAELIEELLAKLETENN